MSEGTITRAQLQAAIEAGIAKATETAVAGSGPTDEDCEALRNVGRETTKVATGSFIEGVGCPVFQAFPESWGSLTWAGFFASGYDEALEEVAPRTGEYEIVEYEIAEEVTT